MNSFTFYSMIKPKKNLLRTQQQLTCVFLRDEGVLRLFNNHYRTKMIKYPGLKKNYIEWNPLSRKIERHWNISLINFLSFGPETMIECDMNQNVCRWWYQTSDEKNMIVSFLR
jgi:hypothetical protein